MGLSNEEMDRLNAEYEKKEKQRLRRRGLWPLMGALMAVSLGFIAYSIGPSIANFAKKQFPDLANSGLSSNQLNLVASGVVFLVFFGLAAVIVALAIPRDSKAKQSTYKVLAKERQAKIKAQDRRKRRRQEVARQMDIRSKLK